MQPVRAASERDQAKRMCDLYEGESHTVTLKDDSKASRLGIKGLHAEGERLERDNAAKLDDDRTEAADDGHQDSARRPRPPGMRMRATRRSPRRSTASATPCASSARA